MPLSQEDEAQFKGLLSAAMDRPKTSLNEKLSTAELLRKWAFFILFAIVAIASEVDQRRANGKRITALETKMKQVRPMVLQHDWQSKQGLTDKDMKDRGLTPPTFPED